MLTSSHAARPQIQHIRFVRVAFRRIRNVSIVSEGSRNRDPYRQDEGQTNDIWAVVRGQTPKVLNHRNEDNKIIVAKHDNLSDVQGQFIPSEIRDLHYAIRAWRIVTERKRLVYRTNLRALENLNLQAGSESFIRWIKSNTRRRGEQLSEAFKGRPVGSENTIISKFLMDGAKLSETLFQIFVDHHVLHLSNPSMFEAPPLRGFPPLDDLIYLEQYLDHTETPFDLLTLESLGLDRPPMRKIASHIAIATGLCYFLKSVFPKTRKGIIPPYPEDVCKRYDFQLRNLWRMQDRAWGLQKANEHIAQRAGEHLVRAREIMEVLRREDVELLRKGFGVFVRAVGARMFLAELKYDGYRLFDRKQAALSGTWEVRVRADDPEAGVGGANTPWEVYAAERMQKAMESLRI